MPEETISKIFYQKKQRVNHLRKHIREMVLFRYYNLIDDLSTFPLGKCESTFDLIICRNVFIYFETSGIKTAVILSFIKNRFQAGTKYRLITS
ncbi:MAG: hypothetical protein IPJ75_17770 [Ignavibacteriales bacterium]|nr:hypothetical protein [Ignavibacteriales bacterium]